MRERNMWIGEIGREQSEVTLDVTADVTPPINEDASSEATDINLTPTNSLASSELSLDELVPRTWKRW